MLVINDAVYEFENSVLRRVGPKTVLVKLGAVKKAKQKGTGRGRKR